MGERERLVILSAGKATRLDGRNTIIRFDAKDQSPRNRLEDLGCNSPNLEAMGVKVYRPRHQVLLFAPSAQIAGLNRAGLDLAASHFVGIVTE